MGGFWTRSSPQSWSASSIGLWSETVSGAYFSEEVLKVIKALKEEGSLRDEDPWVFLDTLRTYYVCFCPPSYTGSAHTHWHQALCFSHLRNRTELSGLRGTALLIQKLVTVTPAQKHFLGSNNQLFLSLINLQWAEQMATYSRTYYLNPNPKAPRPRDAWVIYYQPHLPRL